MATKSAPQQDGVAAGNKPGLRKPVFVKVDSLKPGTNGHTLIVKVVNSNTVLNKKPRNPNFRGPQNQNTKIAECLVGDETGTILFTARNDQVAMRNRKMVSSLSEVRDRVDALGFGWCGLLLEKLCVYILNISLVLRLLCDLECKSVSMSQKSILNGDMKLLFSICGHSCDLVLWLWSNSLRLCFRTVMAQSMLIIRPYLLRKS